MCFCVRSLSTSFCTAFGVTTVSPVPWMMMPEAGQGGGGGGSGIVHTGGDVPPEPFVETCRCDAASAAGGAGFDEGGYAGVEVGDGAGEGVDVGDGALEDGGDGGFGWAHVK